ncbi:unnamed protein product [Mytilus edulis]|uniref:Uncharacterized protein n=1 Tax=Mytilus edulis TaxID=6550 RepID=A0A8S3R7N7_MYTED|nr:unnamed protein product [Mytilus edulis]
MWNMNLPYILVTAFLLLISCKHVILHEIKEWKSCHFASSCRCQNVPRSGNIIADCSGKELLRIPKLPHNLQNLFLQNNNISRIEDGIFKDSSLLTTLDLSLNRISYLRKNSFKGLQNLISLNLSNNDLKYENKSFEISAFNFLENLKSLNLKRNVNTSFVPDLWKLRSLELLSIDYIVDKIAILDEKFSNLKKLTGIDLSGITGNCKMTILTKKTFVFLPQITHLNLSKCKIQHIFKGTFAILRNISNLDVSLNTCLRFETLENITTDLQYSAIKILKVNNIHSIFGMPTVLNISHIWNLKNTSLERFEAAGNRIQRIEFGMVQYLPPSLTSADVGDNIFSLGKYVLDLQFMPIQSLEISDNFSPHNVFNSYVEECPLREENVTINLINNFFFFNELPLFEIWKNISAFPVPGKLKKVLFKSNYMNSEIPSLGFMANELNYLSLSDNVLHTWTGPVTNIKRLTDLDLSANFCSNISKNFFNADFINLRSLLLQNNLLGLVLPTDVDGEIFQNLKNVGYINLSTNKIANIPYLVFKEQHNLERLDLSENMIDGINFKISHMRKLMFLNVRNNRISTLSQYAMNELDSIAKYNKNLTIDLSGNNLVCNCDSLSFVKWIVNTPTHFHLLEKYECKTSKNTLNLFRNPREVLKHCKRNACHMKV